MHHKLTSLALALTVSAWSHAGLTATCTAASGEGTTALLELYTAEGCRNCPAAENWLKSLPALKLPAGQLAPLAFHVDYWNDDWPDPFAQKAFSQRQYRATLLTGATTAYTPQVLLNGREFRWQKEDLRAVLKRLHAEPARAELQLKLAQPKPTELDVSVQATLTGERAPTDLALFVALYENHLQSHITGGESASGASVGSGSPLRSTSSVPGVVHRGPRLPDEVEGPETGMSRLGTRLHPGGDNRGIAREHQHVVRVLHGPFAFEDRMTLTLDQHYPLDPRWKTRDMGIVAFVQDRRTNEVIQTVARALCP